jgi:SSS family solute:Na+ symporter
VFFFIGSGLFAFYEARPDLKGVLVREVTAQQAGEEVLTPEAIGDRAFPHFIARQLPSGAAGLLIAALFAAAMSSIDTSLNSSATIILSDLYPRRGRDLDDRESMRVLYVGTIAVGVLGTLSALGMTGVRSVLDAWWTLSGIFAGGMLGLFLLGLITRKARRPAAVAGVVAGLIAIIWMTVSPHLPSDFPLRSPLHTNMIIVVGTMTIFTVGTLVAKLTNSRDEDKSY